MTNLKAFESQYDEYQAIHNEQRHCSTSMAMMRKGISAFEKLRTYLMINMQALTDNSSSHIAEMLIIGSNMGIIECNKKLKKVRGVEKEITELMERLLKFEEDNVQQLKKFL